MYSNEMIDSYIYGDNSGKPEAAATGQAMAVFNIMESQREIAERLKEIAGFLDDRLSIPEDR